MILEQTTDATNKKFFQNMKQQKKNLVRIKKGQTKGLSLASSEIFEAQEIVLILETATKSAHTRISLMQLFNGDGNSDLLKHNIVPYPGKMYELTGKSNKNIFHIRIGSKAGKNRVRFRWGHNGIKILGVGEFHQKHDQNMR